MFKHHLKKLEIVNLFLLALTGIFLIALQYKPLAWLLWLSGFFLLWWCSKKFKKDLLLVYISMGLLGITPITTDISYRHMFEMGLTLALAVAVPYLISRYIYKDYLVRFKFHHGRKWFKTEILYFINRSYRLFSTTFLFAINRSLLKLVG